MEKMMTKIVNRIKNYLKTWSENNFFRMIAASIRQLFITLLVTYLLLLLIETIFPVSVSRYLNLNYWLIAVIVTGIVTIFTRPETHPEKKEDKHLDMGNIIMFVCTGIIGGALIWYKTREIGWLSYLVSLVGGALIYLLAILIRQKDGEEESEGENNPDS
jgi:hypothetical protein